MAVDLAKLSLWLATLAKDHPFTFLDHALKCGDSLVGLSKKQIGASTGSPSGRRDFARGGHRGGSSAGRANSDADSGSAGRNARSASVPEACTGRRVPRPGPALWRPRRLRLLRRRQRTSTQGAKLETSRTTTGRPAEARHRRDRQLKRARCGTSSAASLRNPASHPFHWEIEFPEVFDREDPGFDAFVGNPPFLGRNSIASNSSEMEYLAWLTTTHEESHGNA